MFGAPGGENHLRARAVWEMWATSFEELLPRQDIRGSVAHTCKPHTWKNERKTAI